VQKGNQKTTKPAKNVLNGKHERFCQEYLIDLNASAAYLRAGYNASQKGAYVLARRLLQKVKIQQRIQELMDARAERLNLTADSVLKELSKLVFANIKDYATWDKDGKITIKSEKELTVAQKACISEIRSDQKVFRSRNPLIESIEEHKLRFKLTDKLKAIELTMRHLSLFNDKQTLEIPQLEQLLAWAEKEVEKIGYKKSAE